MKEWLTVGRKIICIDADPRSCPVRIRSMDMDGLAEGSIYTIRKVGPDKNFGFLCLWTNEIVRPIAPIEGYEVGYLAARFRPLLGRKTDIGVFTSLLKTREMEDA